MSVLLLVLTDQDVIKHLDLFLSNIQIIFTNNVSVSIILEKYLIVQK